MRSRIDTTIKTDNTTITIGTIKIGITARTTGTINNDAEKEAAAILIDANKTTVNILTDNNEAGTDAITTCSAEAGIAQSATKIINTPIVVALTDGIIISNHRDFY